jgi:aminoglycoside phosphotransferase family enzyme
MQNSIPTEEEIQKVVAGRRRRQKGLLQSLWEHGWIDPARLNDYSIEGKTDAMGVKQVNTNLKYLMENCRDFIEKESLLQSNGQKMGIIIDWTPKCHCDLAVEGVEYSWVCAKT